MFYVSDGGAYSMEEITSLIEKQMNKKTMHLTLPLWLLRSAASVMDFFGSVLGKSFAYNSDKYLEMCAPGWVCSSKKIEEQINYHAEYSLDEGIKLTTHAYKEKGWL